MNRKFSIPVSKIDVTDLGNHFLNLKIYAISDGENRNGSEFLYESFEPSIPSFYNRPILAYFNKNINDCEEHNSRIRLDEKGEVFEDFQYEGGEKPVGVIPESADINIEEVDGKHWITITGGIIWSNYSKQIADLIRKNKKKKVSVEVEFLDSHMDGEVEKVKLFKFLGVTILGDKYSEGIEGAHLALHEIAETEQFAEYRKALCFALKETNETSILSKYGINDGGEGKMQKAKFLSKDDYGTGETIKVDKSKEAVSNSSWGAVNKTSLRNETLKAKNYKSLVHDVYLDVKSGWEESPSENLKYPVMQIKGGKAVYNAGGLLSAQQYGEKYDADVAKKALSIRKKLGLAESDKEAKMKKFIDSAKEQGMSFIGLFGDKLRFVEECSFKDDEDIEREEMVEKMAKEEMAVFEIEKEKCGDKFSKDMCDEIKMKKFDDDEDEEEEEDEDDDDIDVKDDPDKKKDKATYAKLKKAEEKCKMAEEEAKKMKKECEAAKEELKKMKKDEFARKMEDVFAEESDEDTKEELKKMAEEDKFATFEDFEKEYAYRKYLKAEAEKKEAHKFKFSASYSAGAKVDKYSDPLDTI